MSVKFGIIIPTYNRPAYLVEAIRSVLAQTWPHWKLFICNDCSVVDYSSADPWLKDPRIFMTRTDVNSGCNMARNAAIDLAISEGCDYIVFMDDEDKLDAHALEVGAKMIDEHPKVHWFISNTTGDRKASQRDIIEERYYDWFDDYMYGTSLRGDKTHMISTRMLGDIRFDGRFRASNMWPFFLPLGARTKIWAYPYPSKIIRYVEGGITKSNTRYPKTWREVWSRFARHACAIRYRPINLKAYKYFALELFKTPRRAWFLATGRIPPTQKS